MTQTLETWYISTLAAKLNATDITCTVATAPTVTAWRMHIYKWNTHAWIKYTGVVGTTLTGVSFVSQTADPATAVTWTTFPAWTSIELVEMHDQMLDKQEGWTIAGDITHTGKLKANKSITVPVYADATARDAWIPSPANGMIVYNTALWIHQQYIGGAWASFASGTTVNADTTTAGKVELPTTDEMTSWSATGWTGAGLAVTPSLLQTYYNFWDGSDWDVVISVNTTLTRDMFYANLTVNTGIVLNPDGFAIYVTGTLTLTGTAKISRLGNNWTDGWDWQNAAVSTAGLGWTALNTNTCGTVLWGNNGWAGEVWAVWTAGTSWMAAVTSYTNITSAASWAGWAGTSGAWWNAWNTAVATRWPLYNVLYDNWKLLALLSLPSRWISSTTYEWSPSAWGGWSGGWAPWYSGWGGGWSWGNGWNILVFANILVWSGTIEAVGWNGGNGWNWHWTGISWGGGGGAGWCGWIIVLCYKTGTPFTTVVTGWTAGSGWTAPWGWTIGSAGSNGTAWTTITIQAI